VTRTLTWKADGSLTRLVAALDAGYPGERLVIDHDPSRDGDSKWFLTWYAPHRTDVPEEGHILQSHVSADDLKDEAEFFVGDDDDR
jgi:hypothetical protein